MDKKHSSYRDDPRLAGRYTHQHDIDSLYSVFEDDHGIRYMITSNPPELVALTAWIKAVPMGAIGIISIEPDRIRKCELPTIEPGPIDIGSTRITYEPAQLVGRWVDVRLGGMLAPACEQLSRESPHPDCVGLTGKSLKTLFGKSYTIGRDQVVSGEPVNASDREPATNSDNQIGHRLGFINWCGDGEMYRRSDRGITWSRGRCWKVNSCAECRIEDRRRWVEHLFGLAHDLGLHMMEIKPGDYEAWQMRVYRSGMDYAVVDHGDHLRAVLTRPLKAGKGRSRSVLTIPAGDDLDALEWLFDEEPLNNGRVRPSAEWSRGGGVGETGEESSEETTIRENYRRGPSVTVEMINEHFAKYGFDLRGTKGSIPPTVKSDEAFDAAIALRLLVPVKRATRTS